MNYQFGEEKEFVEEVKTIRTPIISCSSDPEVLPNTCAFCDYGDAFRAIYFVSDLQYGACYSCWRKHRQLLPYPLDKP